MLVGQEVTYIKLIIMNTEETTQQISIYAKRSIAVFARTTHMYVLLNPYINGFLLLNFLVDLGCVG